MLDKSYIGFEGTTRIAEVEKGQLKFFAEATGETNPIYFDEEAAKAAGHPTIPAPPTFLFSLELLAPDPPEADAIKLLKVDISKVLHGEQQFDYGAPIYAGDTIKLKTKVSDIYEKAGGALEFIVQETEGTNQRGESIGRGRSIIVVRHG